MGKIKVLVTGGSGLVGSHFVSNSPHLLVIAPNSAELNILDTKSIATQLEKHNPDWIVNFAAFTDVSAAEIQNGDESGSAWQINYQGTKNLVDAFKSTNVIHISTDMVFHGQLSQPGPYAEEDKTPNDPNLLTWYGWTKNRAEKIVLQRGGSILRIIYPNHPSFQKKTDYIRNSLQKYINGNLYPLFHDQQISISLVDEITQTLHKIIKTNSKGIFHSSSDTTTPYEVITKLVYELGEDPSVIEATSIVDYLKTQSEPNRYPVYGGLKTTKTENKLELHFSTWQTIIEKLIGNGLKLPERQ